MIKKCLSKKKIIFQLKIWPTIFFKKNFSVEFKFYEFSHVCTRFFNRKVKGSQNNLKSNFYILL